jgi:hypothetical protein
MDDPAEEAEDIVPMEIVSNDDPDTLSDTRGALRRKAATRSDHRYVPPPPPPQQWVRRSRRSASPLPLQDEDIPVRKKPRLETRIKTETADAATKAASADVKMSPPPPADVDDDDDYDDDDYDDADFKPDSVTATKSNSKATGATGRWTREEDAKLTSAVAKICKTKCGKELSKDWVAISALVPSRTRIQCIQRWQNAFDHEIGGAIRRRTGKWTEDEVKKLKEAVREHGAKNWVTIATLVPGRTKN